MTDTLGAKAVARATGVSTDTLRTLMADWDEILATTPRGAPAHLLDTLGTRSEVERARRKRQSRATAASRTP
jgi:hypothetical protein